MMPAPAVCTKKLQRAYFTNEHNDAASIATTIIRHCPSILMGQAKTLHILLLKQAGGRCPQGPITLPLTLHYQHDYVHHKT